MKKGLQSLWVWALALVALSPCHAWASLNESGIPVHTRGVFNLAQVYPSTVGGYPGSGISGVQTWGGSCDSVTLGQAAVPGILSLRRTDQLRLDANCFTVIPDGEQGPCFVQGFQLTKEVPGSFKCPDVYGIPHFDGEGKLIPYRYFQFGSGVRTWWSLNFTQPGTRFILEVTSVCSTLIGGQPRVHKDVWIWRVVASSETLLQVVELMHGGAISILEVPCIIAEDMYVALRAAAIRLRSAEQRGSRFEIENSLFDMEALVVANCLFIEVLRPTLVFPGPPQFGEPGFQPPGNLARTVFVGDFGSAIAGIIDTIENPCCCKLIVDLEWIAIKNGIIAQTPTLPVF